MTDQTVLKNLVERFDNLAMKNPIGYMSVEKNSTSHPHKFLLESFPTYNDFHNYFSDLEVTYNGFKPFNDMLFDVYHDLKDLSIFVNTMNYGQKPENVERVANSMRLFTELSKKKSIQCNKLLAQAYTTKQ